MRKSVISVISLVAFSVLVFSTHASASTVPPSYQDTQQVGVTVNDLLAQGYGRDYYPDRNERMVRQICTAVNRNNGYRFTARSQSYPSGNEMGGTAREEACSKAKLRCLRESPGAPCECIPERIERGGSCERVDAYSH